jgi:hypothetical protein
MYTGGLAEKPFGGALKRTIADGKLEGISAFCFVVVTNPCATAAFVHDRRMVMGDDTQTRAAMF